MTEACSPHCLVESCWFGSVIRCGSDHFEHIWPVKKPLMCWTPVETCWNYWCVGELPLKLSKCCVRRTGHEGDIQWHPGSFLQRKLLANGLLDRFRHVELGDRERMGERMGFMGKVLDISWLLNIIHCYWVLVAAKLSYPSDIWPWKRALGACARNFLRYFGAKAIWLKLIPNFVLDFQPKEQIMWAEEQYLGPSLWSFIDMEMDERGQCIYIYYIYRS